MVFDADGTAILANDAAGSMFGFEPTELSGLTVDQLVPESLRKQHTDHLESYVSDPRNRALGAHPCPLDARRSDGSTFPAEISLTAIGTGSDTKVMCIVRNVSDRLALDSENQMVRRSLDAVDEAVFMFDASTLKFFYANTGACRQTGYSEQELVGGMTPIDIKPLFTEESFATLVAPLRAGERSVLTFETVHRRKDGSEVPVEVLLQHIGSSPTQQDTLMALVRDISNRLRARDQANRLRVVEERERIGRELQDRVIQRLFAIGMNLQGSLENPDRLHAAANKAVDELDDCVTVVRDSVFDLGSAYPTRGG